jgi:hypothetical protein
MDILNFLNSDIILPILALIVIVIYAGGRIRNRKRYKR